MPARLWPALSATTVLALAGLALPAGTASAAPSCAPSIDTHSVAYTPTTLVVSAKGKGAKQHQQVSASVVAPCGNADGTDLQVEVVLSPHDALHALGVTDDHAAVPSEAGGQAYDVLTEYVIRASDLSNSDAGTWTTELFVGDTDGGPNDVDEVDGPSIRVLRDATVTLQSPKSVKHGKKITVKGKLTRADWNKHKDAAYGKQKVQLEFRAQGGAWAPVAVVKSTAKGKLTVKVKPAQDGDYRFVFAGTSGTDAATSKARHVHVK